MDAESSVGDATALIFAGGDAIGAAAASLLPQEATTVLAADSGLHHALALGRHVDIVVGDLDSADPVDVEAAVAAGAEVEHHPADKDATDLELALLSARARGATRLVVAGGGGGRLDHLLANLLLLGSPELADVAIEAWLPGARLTVIRAQAVLRGSPGDLCSLLPVGGPAEGVTTDGLRYPLRREELRPGSTRGISNVFVEPEATVTIERGSLLAVQPDSGDL